MKRLLLLFALILPLSAQAQTTSTIIELDNATVAQLKDAVQFWAADSTGTPWDRAVSLERLLSAITESSSSFTLRILDSASVDTEAELEALVAGVNLLLETEIDASSELLAIMDDETGTGSLVFSTVPTLVDSLLIHQDDATTDENKGGIWFQGDDAGANVTTYAGIAAFSDIVTDGAEEGALNFYLMKDGTLMTAESQPNFQMIANNTTGAMPRFILKNSQDGGLGQIWFQADDLAGNLTSFGTIVMDTVSTVNGAEEAQLELHLMDGGTAQAAKYRFTPDALDPVDDGARDIGTTGNRMRQVYTDDITVTNGIAASELSVNVEELATTGASGELLIGQGATVASMNAMSGDATITNTGAVTIAADAVELAMMAEVDFGDIENSTGTILLDTDVVAAAEMADADHGDVTWASGVATIDDGVVDAAAIAATVTLEDGTLFDFGTNISSNAEGIYLPSHATSCAGAITEGQICWDEDSNLLYVGNGASAELVGPSDGGATAFSAITAGTNAAALVMGTSGSLISSGSGTITANVVDAVGAAALAIGSADVTEITILSDGLTSSIVEAELDIISDGLIDSTEITDRGIKSGDIALLAIDAGHISANVEELATTGASGELLIGQGATVASMQAMTGDATIDLNGALLIANDAVELAMLAEVDFGDIENSTGTVLVESIANATEVATKEALSTQLGENLIAKGATWVDGHAVIASNADSVITAGGAPALLTGATFTGNVVLSGAQSYGAPQTVSDCNGGDNIADFNLDSGNNWAITLGADCEINDPTNEASGGVYTFKFTQDVTGGRTVTRGDGTDFPDSVIVAPGSNEITYLTCESGGSGFSRCWNDSYYVDTKQWHAGAFNGSWAAATACDTPRSVQINSGPYRFITNCEDNANSVFYFDIIMPDGWDARGLVLEVAAMDTTASPSQTLDIDFSAQCRGDSDTVNNTWGTAQNASITFDTQYDEEFASTAAITPNGTCAAGDHVYFKADVDDAGGNTSNANWILGITAEFGLISGG